MKVKKAKLVSSSNGFTGVIITNEGIISTQTVSKHFHALRLTERVIQGLTHNPNYRLAV